MKITEAGQYEGSSFGFFSSGQHFTAFRGDTVYVAWQESRDFTYIFFARSNDGGLTFGPNVVAAGGVNPSMRVDSAGVIYLAYQNSGDIFFRKSTDGGTTFSARVKVNDDTIPQIGQEEPAIAVNNKGQIFIAWIDKRLYPQSIFIAASYDGGNTFTANVQASDSGFYAYSCDIAADDSGRVYVVWSEAVTALNLPLRLARSDDSGQSFSYRTTVSDLPVDPDQVYALWPSAVVGDGGVLGVAWQDRRFNQYTLHFSTSNDYGQAFFPSVRVDDDLNLTSSTAPQTPSLVCRNDIFYVVWSDVRIRASDSQTVANIFFSYSLDTGKSFVPNVDANAADPNRPFRLIPSLAVNETGKAFVCWVDDRYDPVFSEIYQIFGTTGKYIQLLKGDLNLDEMLSAADVVMLVNATFSRQHYPAPFQNADGNCDGKLSGADIVLLLYAVFANNPFPCS
ncbi:MAG: hypothetical protein L0196_00110 [candidate division Zixibacteria bacterium]|nr:hypothetical protein [candidate division Zixibacteria bacterium]